jgi:molecular chaperone GrpE
VIDVGDRDDMSGDDIRPAADDIDDPAHVSEELASDAEAVAEQVDANTDAQPGAGQRRPDEPLELTPEQLDALVAERDEFLDAYRRTAADFDNYRKQAQKRITDEVVRSQGGFVERMLPVLDAIEAAKAHAGDDASSVEAVSKALLGFLEKEGLERVDPAGEPFDPNLAEAVMHEPGDGEPTVVEVLRTGYLWQGRVIRAAMVKVSG